MLRAIHAFLSIAIAIMTSSSIAAQGEKKKEFFDNFQVHAYVNLAWATADFVEGGFVTPESDEVVLGIPEDGTFDYRTAALQLRWDSPKHHGAILQLSHRRFGDSPVTLQAEDDVEVDWLFYTLRWGTSQYVKLGRVPVPIGALNLLRDAPAANAFFRVPFSFYREGAFTTETVDGIVYGGENGSGALRWDLWYGEFEMIEFTLPGQGSRQTEAGIADAKDAAGFSVWWEPATSLRVGVGYDRQDVSGGPLEAPGDSVSWWAWTASLEASFLGDRLHLRTEHRSLNPAASALFTAEVSADVDTTYAQLGYDLPHGLSLWGQWERTQARQESVEFVAPVDFDPWAEVSFAINWASPVQGLLFKAEHRLYEIDSAVPFVAGPGPVFDWMVRPADDGSQTIISASYSF